MTIKFEGIYENNPSAKIKKADNRVKENVTILGIENRAVFDFVCFLVPEPIQSSSLSHHQNSRRCREV